MTRLYTLYLICPRCRHEKHVMVGREKFNARIDCGECLQNDGTAIEMQLACVTCHAEGRLQ